MQISLNIQDDVYQKLVNAGVDMQSKINDYLVSLADKKDDYLNSKQFQEDKAYFHQTLEDIESGKTELLSQEQYENEMEAFEKSL
ncbi:hypothetical protein [Sulfurimonas autotrophica]|uniref:Uncharacterized protein n=1 Tax=Sulfurimonas autotrophica (strain ATCC BAA-671 / DSM 16294 / JCM 11897 / OK10) TaxID=563040 RepID=E0US51_SULAO|nr:hypothetical protein [Sulfurimonas autotrophica]ADN09074.1 hypothetical protein Saut_1025 [Sulfurimonas autotrophica DSM 16294]